MFYGIEVWGLSRPVHDLIAMLLEPISGLLAGVLGVIVLLKNTVTPKTVPMFGSFVLHMKWCV